MGIIRESVHTVEGRSSRVGGRSGVPITAAARAALACDGVGGGGDGAQLGEGEKEAARSMAAWPEIALLVAARPVAVWSVGARRGGTFGKPFGMGLLGEISIKPCGHR